MSEELKKYLWDILDAIARLEKATSPPNTFERFNGDALLINAVERNYEIIGEALKRAKHENPDLPITDSAKIIGLRNIIAHNYDGVEAITLWGITKKNIPILKAELLQLLQGK